MRLDELTKKVTGKVEKGVKACMKAINTGAEGFCNHFDSYSRVSEIDKEISQIYIDTGKKCLELEFGIFSAEAERVKFLKSEKAALEVELLRRRNKVKCLNCGSEVYVKNTYCPECGNLLYKEKAEEKKED